MSLFEKYAEKTEQLLQICVNIQYTHLEEGGMKAYLFTKIQAKIYLRCKNALVFPSICATVLYCTYTYTLYSVIPCRVDLRGTSGIGSISNDLASRQLEGIKAFIYFSSLNETSRNVNHGLHLHKEVRNLLFINFLKSESWKSLFRESLNHGMHFFQESPNHGIYLFKKV